MGDVQDLEMFSLSDRGRVRAENQDSVFVDASSGLFVLADGVGGGPGGGTASRLVVDTMAASLRADDPHGSRTGEGSPPQTETRIAERLSTAARLANRTVLDQAEVTPGLAGMASTLVAGVITADRCISVSAGDSRIYRFRDAQLEQISEDHNLARQLVADGFISEEESGIDKYKNVLTRAIGIQETLEVATYVFPLQRQDVVLACTDGLTNMISDRQIIAVLRSGRGLRDKTKELVRLANEAGGRDNISLILARTMRPHTGIARWAEQLLKLVKGKSPHAETAVDEG